MAAMFVLGGNMIGITAMATEDGDSVMATSNDDPPPGVLKGYMPVWEKVKTGEHFEYFGWVGAPFSRLVSDYTEVLCCRKTLRAMDGCKDTKICPTQS